jgi:NAD(P)H-nitrite reductase large subunit
MHHVIVGQGPAGVVAAETLHKLDPDAEISLVGDEPEPPYSRMAIPYYLSDQIAEQGTHLRRIEGHYEARRIGLVQARIASVDTGAKTLALEGGGSLAYDKLLLATGSHPLIPPIPGIDRPEVHTCWTLEDARQIIRLAAPGKKVVLLGAGFIGCIILEALVERGVELTVVEAQNRMVPRMMNETAGGLIKRWCEGKGVRVDTSTRVEGIDAGRGDHALAVTLDHGDTLDADLLIVAAGVHPNTEFLEGSGIKVDQGVLVDKHLQSSVADVYAAGDVAQGLDFSTGGYAVHAVQPTAVDHARIAASNMVGRRQAYQGSVIMNVLDTLGLVSSSFGQWMGAEGGESAELVDLDRFRYLNLHFEEDRLVGANSLGLIDHVGVIRGLIQTRVRLGGWKDKLIQDPTRLMEAYLARTQPLGYSASVV